MDLFGKTPRPAFNDEMMRELAIYTADQLGESDPEDDEIERIAAILKYHKNDDGFELAKEFEDEGYSIDISTVNDLDNVSDRAHAILKEAVKKWVIADDIKPKIPIGTLVKLKNTIDKKKEGVITGTKAETAEYLVHLEGQQEGRNYILTYESIEEANPEITNTPS